MAEETKRDKFVRIAERRTNDVLDCYRLLANLKSSSYDSTPEMRREILHSIREGLDELELCWAGEKPDKSRFQFKTGLTNGSETSVPFDPSDQI